MVTLRMTAAADGSLCDERACSAVGAEEQVELGDHYGAATAPLVRTYPHPPPITLLGGNSSEGSDNPSASVLAVLMQM
jgi:hypothetical protein